MKDTFNIPRKYSGEFTIGRFFNKRNLFYIAYGMPLAFGLYKILDVMGHMIIGMGVAFVILLAFFGLGSFKLPEDRFESGGDYFDRYLLRSIKKALFKKVYVNYAGRVQDGGKK